MDDAETIIDVHGLTKRYAGIAVVDHVGMQVARGRIHGFLGPNGSGKTTTIRMLCGLLIPDEGSGTCLGFDIRRQSQQIKPHVGYMPQRFGLYEDLSIEENLDFIARIYGVPQRAKRTAETLEQTGLVARRAQLAGTLSGGWKQRLALAACMLHEPRLLLLDEPTAGVDPMARREFWDHLHALAADGITILVSTHYMDEAERCHRLAYISRGRLLAQGTPAELVARAGLKTLVISGMALGPLARALRARPGLQVASFGNSLHVSSASAAQIEAAAADARAAGASVRTVESTLEDVFIALMTQAQGEGDG